MVSGLRVKIKIPISVMIFIAYVYNYNTTYRVTLTTANPTRETKDQIGMASATGQEETIYWGH